MIVPNKMPNIVNSPDIVADTVYLLDNSIQEEDINYQEKEKKLSILLVDDNPDINKILKVNFVKYIRLKAPITDVKQLRFLKTTLLT